MQSQQRGSLYSTRTELTIPQGTVSLFGIFSGNSPENRANMWVRTGIAKRLDIGVGYSDIGKRGLLLTTWHALSEQDGAPCEVLVGYGLTSTNSSDQEGLYLFAIKPVGRASFTGGYEYLRNGKHVGIFSASYLLTNKSGLMLYSHTPTESGKKISYNLAYIHSFGDTRVGFWWFHPNDDSTFGISITHELKFK